MNKYIEILIKRCYNDLEVKIRKKSEKKSRDFSRILSEQHERKNISQIKTVQPGTNPRIISDFWIIN